mgnify:FL=1
MQRELVSRRRCMCCGGVIDGLADDEAIEFDARIGLFTDECAFVCNNCTASLIAARRRQETVRRK